MSLSKRRRRRKTALIADRVINEVKRKKREFLREASKILSDAIGFPVRVSLVPLQEPRSPNMRRAARMTKREAMAQMQEAFAPPSLPAEPESPPPAPGPSVLEEIAPEPTVKPRRQRKKKAAEPLVI